ncbi:MAG: PAS domain S-box protein [Methanoregula sp.]|jgi:PAS domain S-box-containing protein|nr:PAS domain S-box protein [Methanoregula sp.]
MDSSPGPKSLHILILDNNTAHQDLCQRAFRDDPGQFRISIAANLRKAREILKRDPPDLIIADRILPDGNGLEILPRIDGKVTTPLIIMASHSDEQIAVEIMKSGAIDYMVKSATMFRELPHIARRALSDWENIRTRKLAETAAQETQKRLADILSFLPDAVFAIDNNGIVIAWNTAMETMTGVPSGSMLGKGNYEYSLPFYGIRRPILIDLLNNPDGEIEKKYLYIQNNGQSGITAETFIPALDRGRGAYLWGVASPLYDPAGNRVGTIEVIRDITERKRAEENLHESETRFKDLLNNMSSGVAIYEPTPNAEDFIIRDVNHAVETIEHVKKDEIIGRSVLEIFPGVKEFGLFGVFQRVARTGIAESHPVSIYKDDRISGWRENYVYRLPSGEVVALYEDVTEKKRAEEALRESELRYRSVVENAAEGITVVQDGKLQYANARLQEMIQVRPEEFANHPFTDFIHPDDRAFVFERYKRRLSGEDVPRYYDFRIVGKNGTVFWIQLSAVRILWNDKPATLNFLTDITDRKQSEEIREAYEARLNSAMEIGSLAWWEMDLPDGAIRFDDRKATMLGYSPKKFRHYTDFTALLNPEDYEPVMKVMKDHLEGREAKYHADYRIRASDGNYRWFRDIGGITKYNGDGTPATVTGIVIDITARMLSEVALRATEARFRALIQNSSDIIHILDKNGLILYESDSAERILGYPPGSMIGKQFLEFIHPDDRESVKTDFQKIADRSNSGTPTEFRVRKADGIFIWVDAIGTNLLDIPGVNGNVITTRPIQQRKEAEQALKESEDRLRLALEGADAGSWDWNLSNGNAVFSDRFYTMLDYEPGGFPATYEAWSALMHPEDRERVLPDLMQQISDKRPLCEIEYRLMSKGGNWLWLLGRGKITETDEQGKPVRMTGVNIDITNRRMMESEIRSLNTSLEQRVKERTEALQKANDALEKENAQRVTAEKKLQGSYDEKVMLLKEIHHRVKNNLQIIASLLNLQSRYIKDEPTLAAIRESQNRVKAMALVHEKLYRSEDIAHISLQEYIRFLGAGLFQFYDAKARGIQFTLDIHDVDADIDVAIPLGLILNELISNSLKYAFPENRQGEITVSVKKDGHTLTVVFRDTGVGIPADLDWQNTQSLGLRLVNTLVDQMNGTIELDRSAGTLFTMIMHEKEQQGDVHGSS